jgi:hypothetical protein
VNMIDLMIRTALCASLRTSGPDRSRLAVMATYSFHEKDRDHDVCLVLPGPFVVDLHHGVTDSRPFCGLLAPQQSFSSNTDSGMSTCHLRVPNDHEDIDLSLELPAKNQ